MSARAFAARAQSDASMPAKGSQREGFVTPGGARCYIRAVRTKSGSRRVKVATSGRERPRAKLWAYGYADLALLFGMTEGAVRQAVRRGAFDPRSLESIFEHLQRRRARAAG